MKIVAFIHDPKEISAIAKNRGIQPYRAPPPLNQSNSHSQITQKNAVVICYRQNLAKNLVPLLIACSLLA